MDPHSRLSQYNHRPPKAGPRTQTTRALPMDKKKQAGLYGGRFDASAVILISRPIATNSRVKKTEKLHRDMHLAFVNDALERKSQVRSFSLSPPAGQPTLDRRETPKISTSWSASSIPTLCPTTHPCRGLSFGSGFPHFLMSSPAWSGHTPPFLRLSSRCLGQPWTVNSPSPTPRLSACSSAHDRSTFPACLKRSLRDLLIVRDCLRFRLSPFTHFFKILAQIPLTSLRQNLRPHLLRGV
jgi:hypothetical protein